MDHDFTTRLNDEVRAFAGDALAAVVYLLAFFGAIALAQFFFGGAR